MKIEVNEYLVIFGLVSFTLGLVAPAISVLCVAFLGCPTTHRVVRWADGVGVVGFIGVGLTFLLSLWTYVLRGLV